MVILCILIPICQKLCVHLFRGPEIFQKSSSHTFLTFVQDGVNGQLQIGEVSGTHWIGGQKHQELVLAERKTLFHS